MDTQYPPKFPKGTQVAGVRGPGGRMEVHPRNLGRIGTIERVVYTKGTARPHYKVRFLSGSWDYADECCLERA